MQWYYADNDQQKGPISEEDLKQRFREGIVRSDTLVWKAGMGDWQPYQQVFGSMPMASMTASSRMDAYHPHSVGTGGTSRNKDLRIDARAALSGNWLKSAGLLVVMGLLMMLTGLIPFAGLIISGPLMLGMYSFFLKLSRGEYVDIGQLFRGFEQFGSALALYLLTLLVYVGVALLVFIPFMVLSFSGVLAMDSSSDISGFGVAMLIIAMYLVMMVVWMVMIYVQSRIGLAFFYLYDERDAGAVAAFGSSWRVTKAVQWKLFRMHIFFGLLYILAYLVISMLLTPAVLINDRVGIAVVLLFYPIFAAAMCIITPYMFVSIAKFYDDLRNV